MSLPFAASPALSSDFNLSSAGIAVGTSLPMNLAAVKDTKSAFPSSGLCPSRPIVHICCKKSSSTAVPSARTANRGVYANLSPCVALSLDRPCGEKFSGSMNDSLVTYVERIVVAFFFRMGFSPAGRLSGPLGARSIPANLSNSSRSVASVTDPLVTEVVR